MSDKRTKRTFTKEQKLAILEEAAKHGVQQTLDKHALYPATYYAWKKKLQALGAEGLAHGMTKKQLKELRRIEDENRKLKELLGQKELEIQLQQELIKKKYPENFSSNS